MVVVVAMVVTGRIIVMDTKQVTIQMLMHLGELPNS